MNNQEENLKNHEIHNMSITSEDCRNNCMLFLNEEFENYYDNNTIDINNDNYNIHHAETEKGENCIKKKRIQMIIQIKI